MKKLKTKTNMSMTFKHYRDTYDLEALVERDHDNNKFKFRIYRYLYTGKGLQAVGVNFDTYEQAESEALNKIIEVVNTIL